VTRRSAAIQGGLAAVGLLVAHLTWQREPEHAPGEVTVIDASKADVSRVRYEDADNVLGLERRTEGGEPVVWLHLEQKPKDDKKDDKKDDRKDDRKDDKKDAAKLSEASPPKTPPGTPPRDVRGNADALKLADRFAPFVSPRAFGVIEGDKLKELGLDAPTRHLDLVVRGDTRAYDVGIALNAQNGEAFLRDTRDHRVYLMPRGLLIDLGNGKRLVDARLHTFDTKEFDRVAITLGGKHKEFVHLGRENFSTETYAAPKTPDKGDPMAKNWLEMVWRLFPMEVLGKDEQPKGEALKVVFRVDYSERGKPVGWLELARMGETSAGTMQDNLYARSEHSVGWTRLHSTDQVIVDAEKVMSAP
jgi:hypothetical protein